MKKTKGLCEICSPKQWKTISTDMLTDGGYPVYGANGVIGCYSEYNHVEPTLLVTCRGATCGTLNICEPYSYVNGNAMALDNLTDEVDIKYLYYYLLNRGFEDVITGSAQPQIVRQSLQKVNVTYPDKERQAEIVTVLERVSKLIALRKEQLAKLDQLVKSRFVELFGKEKFSVTSLIELITKGAGLSYGIIVPGDNVEDGVPMIRPSDFVNDKLYLDNVYRVTSAVEAKYAKTRLIGDEILVQVIGQPGQIMLSDSRCKGMNVTRNLAVVRPDCNKINRIYLKTYMQTQEAQAFMLGETKQSTLKQLPLGRLKELAVPVPPIDLQNQFATFVEQTDKSKLAIQQSLDKLELLKKSLMQKYFG